MPKFAANLTMLFNEVAFLDRFALAAKAGFTGVEYHFPYEFDKAKLSAPLKRHNLEQVLFDLPAGDWAGGERGIGCLPDRRREFQDGVHQAIEYASALGCRRVNCLAGIGPPGETEETLRATFTANLRFAAEALDKAGIKLLIEPINTRDVPGFYLRYTSQALEIMREVGSSNLYLQYDVFHMQIMEGDLARTIEANLPLIAHMQVAGTPGRHEPGTGEIDYNFLFAFIDRIGYAGWIGAEYTPASTTEAGLSWFRPYAS